MKKNQSKVSVKGALVVVGLLVVIMGGSIAALSLMPREKIESFEDCKNAGGAILESYPEQCMIDDLHFVNDSQPEPVPPYETDEYIGLSESEALEKAEQAKIPARVVQRDDESLPVTMDFVFGRYNFYVRDGAVNAVEVEGQATDAN